MLSFSDFIEAINYKTVEVIINKGEVLYHGTGESFDTRKPKPGGYDNVFWTTDDLMIARSYIPQNGSYSSSNIEFLLRDEKTKKALGVTKEIERFAWKKQEEGYQKVKYWGDKERSLAKQWQEMEGKFTRENWDAPAIDELFKQWREAEENHRKYQREWKTHEYYLKDFIARKLKNLGYEIGNDGRIARLLQKLDGTILPASNRLVGKVLKITCKRDFKVFNMTYQSDGDLMEPDYHKISSFKKLEEKGYDGVIINDFAQTSYHGNLGHRSIGFFEKALPDLEIKQIRSQTHPKDEEWT